jgi:hypothetical protein
MTVGSSSSTIDLSLSIDVAGSLFVGGDRKGKQSVSQSPRRLSRSMNDDANKQFLFLPCVKYRCGDFNAR